MMKRSPIRTCVSCRTSSEKRGLIRIVRASAGEVKIDPTGKMPGRGAYFCGRKECLAALIKQNKLGRALRCNVPEEVIRELEKLVVEDDARN